MNCEINLELTNITVFRYSRGGSGSALLQQIQQMNSLHTVGLMIHFIALFIMGGGTLGAFIMEQVVWKKSAAGSREGRVLMPAMMTATKFILTGMLLFVISGILMLGSVNWIFIHQPWFIAKLVLFLSLPVRGATVGKPILKRTAEVLNQESVDINAIQTLRFRMNRFHVIQYSIAFIIIFLVLFRP